MNLVIKNMKYSKFASQETNCFECDIYFDGKKTLRAFNDGRGGTTRFDKYVEDGFMTLKLYTEFVNATNLMDDCIQRRSCEIIDIEVQNYLIKKDSIRHLKSLLKKSIVFLTNHNEIRYYRIIPNEINIAKIKTKHPNNIILNCLAFDQALSIFREKLTNTKNA